MNQKKLSGVAITVYLLMLACLLGPTAAQAAGATMSCGGMGVTATGTAVLGAFNPTQQPQSTMFEIRDLLTGAVLASNQLIIAPKRAGFLSYSDPSIPTGGRREVVGRVISSALFPPTLPTTLQVLDAGAQLLIHCNADAAQPNQPPNGYHVLGPIIVPAGATARLAYFNSDSVSSLDAEMTILNASSGARLAAQTNTLPPLMGANTDFTPMATIPILAIVRVTSAGVSPWTMTLEPFFPTTGKGIVIKGEDKYGGWGGQW